MLCRFVLANILDDSRLEDGCGGDGKNSISVDLDFKLLTCLVAYGNQGGDDGVVVAVSLVKQCLDGVHG